MNDIFRLILAVFLLLCGCSAKDEALPAEPVFVYEGVSIVLNSQAQEVLDALGDPQSFTQTPSCAFEGMDKTYGYGSFYLTTYPEDGEEYILRLWFADDTAETAEGLRIGDSAEKIGQLYEQAEHNGAGAYSISSEGYELMILTENGTVSTIVYEAIIP